MPEFDAILFDFDGVLVDSEPMHYACWAEVLAPLGVTLEWDWFREYGIGVDDRAMLRIVAAGSDPPIEWERLWEQYPTKRDLFRSRMMQTPPFPPALAGLLERLRPHFKMAVVTSSGRPEIEPLLEAGGLLGYFDTLVCAREAERLKPFPDPYLLAARRLSARTALVVEDSPAGIASGRAAGFEVLTVTHPTEVPDLVLRRLSGSLPAG